MKKSKPIAIFYHIYLGGGVIPCDSLNVTRIVTDQLSALNVSGVVKAATDFIIGVSGGDGDGYMVAGMAKGAQVIQNVGGVGELPTMKLMQEFAVRNSEHNILYLHTKGAIHNGNPTFEAWRLCMERVVIWQWQKCADALNRGYDTAGAHWLTPGQYSFIGPLAYWGGNFFWATAKYLNTLPPIDVNADRYQAEVWIGKAKRKPNVVDFAKHFPMSGCQV